MAKLLVVGSCSLDTLFINGESVPSAGGAGMYTAMAARRSGASVSMFGLRPDPMPDVLRPVAHRLDEWIGPTVSHSQMPHFEISHQGDKAIYHLYSTGVESDLDPRTLPGDLSAYDSVHVIPLGDSGLQFEFLLAARERGARFLSASTFFLDIQSKPRAVRRVLEIADVFFCNEDEAAALFGSLEAAHAAPGRLLFITLGRKGALVWQGNHRTFIAAPSVETVDPTGAGDTFCGAALANLLDVSHPLMAARLAMALAGQEIGYIGPEALFRDQPPPDIELDPRVSLDDMRIEKVTAVIETQPAASPFNFVTAELPPPGHPAALDYFFTATLQQFGFWEATGGRYARPLFALIGGENCKGSSYLYRAYLNRLDADPDFFSPARQSSLTEADMLELFRSDDGTDPMPALDLHLSQAVLYGEDMLSLGLTPRDILERAGNSAAPLKTFLRVLNRIGGYKEDPLRKKSSLLALCLNQRPEVFLEWGNDESVEPVIDYHAMRSCLRLGLVEVHDPPFSRKLADRRLVSPDEEWAVRYAAFLVEKNIARISGKRIGAVDWFFFNYMRSTCLETAKPLCARCAADGVCAHRKDLFQPVIRTTFY